MSEAVLAITRFSLNSLKLVGQSDKGEKLGRGEVLPSGNEVILERNRIGTSQPITLAATKWWLCTKNTETKIHAPELP